MLSFVSGCTATPSAHEGLEVTDSAGVRIVVVHDSLREEHFPAVRLLEGVDTIGVALGEDPYQFSYLRGAVLTREGILVADEFSREIRYFDGQGRFLASLGREGEGPGEFETLSWIRRGSNGILFAWDGRASRLTSIAIGDSALAYMWSRRLNVVPWKAQAMGVVGAGQLLLVGAGSDRPTPVPGRVNGGEMMVGVGSEETLPAMHRLATVPSQPAYLSNDMRIAQVPFTVLPDYAVGPESVWLGSGIDGEIREVDLDGRVRVILRLPSQGPVTDHDLARFIESDLEDHEEAERPRRRQLLNEIPMPRELPAFNRLRIDDDQRLWVGGYNSGSSPVTPWHVFDRDGCPVGRVVMPAGLQVLAIGQWRIVGGILDELGVRRVLIYRFAESFETEGPQGDCQGGGSEAPR